jgi:hypothetical protein
MSEPSILSVPLQLRANDIQRHILNIDTRFRDSAELSSASNFYYTLAAPIKNILRIRITSVEFPNNYYQFTRKRKNVTFRVIYQGASGTMGQPIEIEEGTYNAFELQDALNAIFQEAGGLGWLSVAFSSTTGHYVFTGTQNFAIDTSYETYDRLFDYGLTYYMGFSQKLHKAVAAGAGKFIVESDGLANFAGDPYMLLRLNDFQCVKHRTDETYLEAFAKLVLRDQKNNVNFDDYASRHIKEVVFPAPQDLTRLKIQMLDAYGELADLSNINYSFSIEIMEIKNMSLYNVIRDSLALSYSGSRGVGGQLNF